MNSIRRALPVFLCLAGCSHRPSDPAPTTERIAPIEAREISGMFVCEQSGLLVIYSFLRDGGGLATIDTEFDRAQNPPTPTTDSVSSADEQTITLTPTVVFSWTLTPPNLLTIDLPWPEEQPKRHFLRVERLENGKPSLIEMETPTGPDLGLVFHFDHDLLDPAH